MPDKVRVSGRGPDELSAPLPGGLKLPLPSPRTQAILLSLSSALVIALIVLVALVHLTDRHRTDHVAGAWMALTRYAEQGVFYPALFDGERYGGTRWMPLSLVYNLAFAQLGSDLMTTGKLAALVGWSAVMGLSYALLRTLTVERSVALLLLALAATCEPLLLAAWAPFRGDTPALALQLAAALLAARAPPTRATAGLAGALAALALLAKASAGWAPMAIGLYYLLRARRQLGVFVAVYVVVAALGVAAFEVLSEGRMLAGFFALSTSGLGPRRLLGAFGRMLYMLETEVTPLWALQPLVGLELLLGLARGRLHLVHMMVGACLVVSLVIFADLGVSSNHLVDLLVLSVAAVGLFWVRVRDARAPEAAARLRAVLYAALAWALLSGIDLGLADPVAALRRAPGAHDKAIYESLAEPHHRLLSEDPTLPVRLGQDPLVLDAFMWHRLDEVAPEQTAKLVERVRREQLDRIVLLMDPEEGLEDGWYVRTHFSEALVRAVLEHYRLVKSERGFWVYAPAGRRAPGAP